MLLQSPPDAEVLLDGRRYRYFAGTGYLGLQGHPEVIAAACDAMQRYGIGSATNRAWFGTTPPLLEVERLAAQLFAADDAYYYASGYLGNAILLGALAEHFDALFLDERSHYSLFDAARASGKPCFGFAHRDPQALADSLRANLKPGQRPLVASDGVFSVLGTIAPAADYRRVLGAYDNASLLLDDAHAAGVLGAAGRGTYAHLEMLGGGGNRHPREERPADGGPALYFTATLSKALGGFGGILPGTQAFHAWLRAHTHTYDGASAPPVPAAAASAKALEIVLAQPELRTRLGENVRTLQTGLRLLGIVTHDTPVPIFSFALDSAQRMAKVQQQLAERGILIAHAARYSGVGPGGLLRIAVFATHTRAMIEELLAALAECLGSA